MTELIKIGDATFSRPGTSTTIKDGALTALADNEPAFEGGGLRAWVQVTNLFMDSNNSSNAWSGIRSNITNQPGSLLDGYSSITSSDPSAASHYIWVYDGSQVTSGQEYTLTAYVMLIDTSVVNRVRIGSNSLSPSSTTTGVLQQGVWYRLEHKAIASTSRSLNAYIWPELNTSATPAIPDGFEYMRVACVQLEAGNIASPHIPTSGTAVTSPKETCTMPTPAALSGSAWSIVVSITPSAVGVTGNYRFIGCGTNADGLELIHDANGTVYGRLAGVQAAILNAVTNGVLSRFVMVRNANTVTITGTAGSSSFTIASQPVLGSLLYIGSNGSGFSQLNGNINDIRFYSKALSPSEIAGLLA